MLFDESFRDQSKFGYNQSSTLYIVRLIQISYLASLMAQKDSILLTILLSKYRIYFMRISTMKFDKNLRIS